MCERSNSYCLLLEREVIANQSFQWPNLFYKGKLVAYNDMLHVKCIPLVFVIQPGKALHWGELEFQKNEQLNYLLHYSILPQKTIKYNNWNAVKMHQYWNFIYEIGLLVHVYPFWGGKKGVYSSFCVIQKSWQKVFRKMFWFTFKIDRPKKIVIKSKFL